MEGKIGKKIVATMLLGTISLYTMPVLAVTKEETVYSKLNSNGEAYTTIVSSHIKNEEITEVIKDMSDLLNIENVGGNQNFTQEENNIIWDAKGNDIYYQGETKKELPIKCNIKYELDGKEMSSEEIVGKAGKVKVTISYENKDAHQVKINGRTETMYTPFLVVAGTIIDSKNNTNIEISNGKIIENEGNITAVGIALPGVQESLKISKEKIEIPSSIEISMNTKEFELNSILSYVTPKLFDTSYSKIFDKLDTIYSEVDKMKTASGAIENGAEELKNGSKEFFEKSNTFNGYMGKLENGTNEAKLGILKISTGVNSLYTNSKKLNEGAQKVNEGVNNVKENIELMNSNAGTLATGTSAIYQTLGKLSVGIDKINSSLEGVDVSKDNSAKIAELTTLVGTDTASKNSLLSMNTLLQAEVARTADEALKSTLNNQITLNTNMINLLDANINANNQAIALLGASNGESLKSLISGVKEIKGGIDQILPVAKKVDTGTSTLTQGITKMNTGLEDLVVGSKELATGTGDLETGSTSLKQGTDQLKQGLIELNDSTIELNSANTKLTQGAKSIYEGATTLSEGITQFNTEAIDKISSYVNSDIKDITKRAKALNDLSKNYINFSMLEESMKGSVKFVMVSDEIKKK